MVYSRGIVVFFFVFQCFITAFAQPRALTGTVTDTLAKPLERANVMARSLPEAGKQEGGGIKFAMADHQGRYRLELDGRLSYAISVSYIGYHKQEFVLAAGSDIKEHHFRLVPNPRQLDEVTIDYDYQPVEIKKDTITFRVDAFTSGNERKLKEVLEKLPGMEVDENGRVTFQGNTVNTTLVENKKFFGGGSKLAVDNIPADAVDKIEMISHFSEVDFMKEVLSSDELAMNVKLKKDKKDLVFGDLEAGAGPSGYHHGHAGLFYFTPENSISFIGDINNIGKSVFTFDDVMRFQGGISSYMSNMSRPSFTNLSRLSQDNRDVLENKSRFAALNFDRDLSRKFNVSGFGIFSSQLTQSRREEFLQYLTNQQTTEETRETDRDNDDLMGLANIKLDYSPTRYQKWYYNGQLQLSRNDFQSLLLSQSQVQDNRFESSLDNRNLSLKQYVEWHKSYSAQHTTTLVVNHVLDHTRPQTQWINDQAFLAGFLPLLDDEVYQVSHVERQRSNGIDALFKHYWVINRYGQITTNVGNNYTAANLYTADRQTLLSGAIHDFAPAGFGNSVDYGLNDAYLGLEYRFYIRKLENTASLYGHWYHLNTVQVSGTNTLSRFMLEPRWQSKYEFNTTESLHLNYRLQNTFPRIGQLNERFSLSAYNAVASGNALLQNERFHTGMLRYHKFGLLAGTTISGMLSLNRKVSVIRDELFFEGINQYRMPVMTDNPETNWNASGSYERKIFMFRPGISGTFSWFNYQQTVNQILADNTRTSQSVTLSLRIAEKKWPSLNLRYTKGFNQFRGNTQTRFETDRFHARFDYRFLPSWVVEADYDYFRNLNITTSNSDFYQIANAALDYQKKNSAWGFRLTANNLLNNRTKVNNSISDFLVSEQTTFVLPRVLMLGVRYKL